MKLPIKILPQTKVTIKVKFDNGFSGDIVVTPNNCLLYHFGISIGNAVVKAVEGTINFLLTNFTGDPVTLKKLFEVGTLEECSDTLLSEFPCEHLSVSKVIVEEDSKIIQKSTDKFL